MARSQSQSLSGSSDGFGSGTSRSSLMSQRRAGISTWRSVVQYAMEVPVSVTLAPSWRFDVPGLGSEVSKPRPSQK